MVPQSETAAREREVLENVINSRRMSSPNEVVSLKIKDLTPDLRENTSIGCPFLGLSG